MDVDCGSARDRLGRTLGGKYHLKQVLGAGGTAVVYRASGVDGMPVAVKVLHDHLSRSEEVCRRFVREGQLGNVLDHPGTVRVLDHGSTEEGCPYLVLEFLEGESLEERRVRAGGRLDMWETLDFCDQLLAVLEIAHAKNIVHRDIKPSNLFVTKAGVLKVLDFGIARLTDDTSATSTKTGQTVGTPAFMPPEQALSRPRDVDARTDIWSVGATLFTLLSGEHVHIAETSSEHLVKAATLHARSLARALPGVPSNVEALVARCLAFDKHERWSSATSMRAELSFVRDDPGRRIGTSTSPPPERQPSDPNIPTLVGSIHDKVAPISHDGFSPALPSSSGRVDRISDTTEMSLVSNPGAYDLFKPRRKWIVPALVGSTSLLAVASTLLLVLSIRTKNEAAASLVPTTSTTITAPASRAEPPPEVVELASGTPAPEAAPAMPVADTSHTPDNALATGAGDSATRTVPASPRTPSSSPKTAAPQPPAAKSATPAVKKPANASRKDVYRPF